AVYTVPEIDSPALLFGRLTHSVRSDERSSEKNATEAPGTSTTSFESRRARFWLFVRSRNVSNSGPTKRATGSSSSGVVARSGASAPLRKSASGGSTSRGTTTLAGAAAFGFEPCADFDAGGLPHATSP